MKKSRSVPLAMLVTFILVAAPLGYFWNSEKLENRDLSYENERMAAELATAAAKAAEGEMLFYDLNGLAVTAESKAISFSDFYSIDDLNARAADCEKTVDPNYYTSLTAQFGEGMQYSFTSYASGATEEVYTVTVFPNGPEYKDLAAFAADFPSCSVGLVEPARMNQDKLTFESACSAAYGDEVPALTCADIQKDLILEFN